MRDRKTNVGVLGFCLTLLGLIAMCGGSAGVEVWCGTKRT